MRALMLVTLAVLAGSLGVSGSAGAGGPLAAKPGTAACSDYPNQAAAQAAADTNDANNDGIYCNDLPCPCSQAARGGSGSDGSNSESSTGSGTCSTPEDVQELWFSKARFPNIRAHFLAAVRNGWPQILVVDRPGAGARRDKLLAAVPTKTGYDRDEYPPAVGRGKYRKAPERGADPLAGKQTSRTWCRRRTGRTVR